MQRTESKMCHFGEYVIAARKAKGLSVQQLAKKAGISPSHTTNICAGRGAASDAIITAWARSLGVAKADLWRMRAKDEGRYVCRWPLTKLDREVLGVVKV